MPDPRAKHTPEDRNAQFDLAMKLHDLLGDMTFAWSGSTASASGTWTSGPRSCRRMIRLATRLEAASAQVDELRKKIVATKEGGMITGEERLREYLSRPLRQRHLLRRAPVATTGGAHRRARARDWRRRKGFRRVDGEGTGGHQLRAGRRRSWSRSSRSRAKSGKRKMSRSSRLNANSSATWWWVS